MPEKTMENVIARAIQLYEQEQREASDSPYGEIIHAACHWRINYQLKC